jgi:hypothetical protein
MQLTTEQSEAEAEKAAMTDASAMDKLMAETLDQPPPMPEPETPPPAEPEKPKTEEPKKEEKAPTPEPAAAEKPPELDEFEKELESEAYNLPAGATKRAREINKLLKQKANEKHRAFRDSGVKITSLETTNKELEAKLAEAAKYKEELDRYRPIVETMAVEQDPNLNINFRNEMAKIDHRIMTTLAGAGLDKETAKYIMENGGPSYFSKDDVSRTAVKDGPEMTHREFWQKEIIDKLNEERRESLDRARGDAGRAKDDYDATVRSRLANREQYFKDVEEQSKKNEENFKAECLKELNSQREELGDFAKEKTLPANATPEEKKSIEAHNAIIKEATEKFDAEFLDTTPKALVRKALGSLYVPAAKAAMAQAHAERDFWKGKHDELQKKWNASLKAANTSHRQSVQQQPKPLEGEGFIKDHGLRMEKMMEGLPAAQ